MTQSGDIPSGMEGNAYRRNTKIRLILVDTVPGKKKSNKTGLKLEIETELHSVAETGTELKPSKPHNAAGPVLWFLTSGSTLSHWIDIFMDHLGSVVLHECKLP